MDFGRNPGAQFDAGALAIGARYWLTTMYLRSASLRSVLLVGLCLAMPLMALPVRTAAQIDGLEISMDELFEDKRNARIIARGNVEIRYFGEILLADEVIYERKQNRLWARGNLQLQEADGKITRTDRMSLDEGLRDAFIRYARREKVLTDP